MPFRKGQWVKIARELDVAGGKVPVGAVGIHVGPVLQPATGEWVTMPEGLDPEQRKVWEMRRDANRTPHATLRHVDLVEPQAGTREEQRIVNGSMMLVTISYAGGSHQRSVAVPEEDLIAITSKDDIPADRRATMAADFTPYADAGQRTQ